jgi:hypothetical protein
MIDVGPGIAALRARISPRLSPSVLRMNTAFWPVVFS